MKISLLYTYNQWRDAFRGYEDWETAIKVVEDRIVGRWLNPIESLVNEPHSGFAILALDCIVLESLCRFINGKAMPRGREIQVYKSLLTGPRFRWSAQQSESFRRFVRNGVIRDAETRKGWLVGRTTPRTVVPQADKSGGYRLNRTKFHQRLKATFDDWIAGPRLATSALATK
jgi:hypothetical protein